MANLNLREVFELKLVVQVSARVVAMVTNMTGNVTTHTSCHVIRYMPRLCSLVVDMNDGLWAHCIAVHHQ